MKIIEETLELIRTTLDDLEAQENALESTNDIDWDCYQKANWTCLADNLRTVIKNILDDQEKK